MTGFQWIQHKGKKIIYWEMAGKSNEEILEAIARAKVEIKEEPKDSVLCLINAKDGKISTEINQAFKDLSKEVDSYMKMTVVIGVEGLQTIMLNGIIMFTRSKKVIVKKSKEEALDCLVEL